MHELERKLLAAAYAYAAAAAPMKDKPGKPEAIPSLRACNTIMAFLKTRASDLLNVPESQRSVKPDNTIVHPSFP